MAAEISNTEMSSSSKMSATATGTSGNSGGIEVFLKSVQTKCREAPGHLQLLFFEISPEVTLASAFAT